MARAPLPRSLVFERPLSDADGHGRIEVGWTQVWACRAALIHQRGAETFEGGRPTAKETFKVKIRNFPEARAVTADCRARDVDRETVLHIVSIDALSDADWIWIVATTGEVE